MISLLEPKPGRDYGGQEPAYIVPDVFIHKMGEDYVVLLNEGAVPRLRQLSDRLRFPAGIIQHHCSSLLRDHGRRGVGIPRGDRRHNRSVDYSEPQYAANFQPFVNNGQLIAFRSHLGRAHRMKDCCSYVTGGLSERRIVVAD